MYIDADDLGRLAAQLTVRRSQTLPVDQLPEHAGAVLAPPGTTVDVPTSPDLRRNLEMTDRLLLSPVEAANLLGIGRSTLYVLMQSGDLASVRIGGSRRIPVAALDELVNRLRGATDPMSWPLRNGNVSA